MPIFCYCNIRSDAKNNTYFYGQSCYNNYANMQLKVNEFIIGV